MSFVAQGGALDHADMAVEAPSLRVRDGQNMIVVPGSLAGSRFLVHYTVEVGSTHVRDVWILRPEEAAVEERVVRCLDAALADDLHQDRQRRQSGQPRCSDRHADYRPESCRDEM